MITPPVLITGGTGFIGWHIRCALAATGIRSVPLDRNSEWRVPETGQFVIVHAAGLNRAEPHDLDAGNAELAMRALALADDPTRVRLFVNLNSTQAGNGTPYGTGKLRAAELLASACDTTGIRFVGLVLPNVFGEHGRPDYNSFVATFAAQIAAGAAYDVTNDQEVELTHVSAVADTVVNLLTSAPSRSIRLRGTHHLVSAVGARLEAQAKIYRNGSVADLQDPFNRQLFATLRSYLFPGGYPIGLDRRDDQRWPPLRNCAHRTGGPAFVSWAIPGITHGNHFHRRKFERFSVLEGTATIRLRRLSRGDNRVHCEWRTARCRRHAYAPFAQHHQHGNKHAHHTFLVRRMVRPERPRHICGASRVVNSSASLSFTPGTSPRLRTLSIVGTRPELIRLSATLALLDRATEQRLVHTGQNYDFELNQIFVEELGIRSPGHYLDANTSTVASMVGDVIARLDPILRDFQPQAFCVLGDTNSALGAYAARRLGIPDGIHTS